MAGPSLVHPTGAACISMGTQITKANQEKQTAVKSSLLHFGQLLHGFHKGLELFVIERNHCDWISYNKLRSYDIHWMWKVSTLGPHAEMSEGSIARCLPRIQDSGSTRLRMSRKDIRPTNSKICDLLALLQHCPALI